MGAVFTDKLIG